MVHPVIWPKKTFFYPIGNTPPICLTQALSPGKKAEVVLLGCGDPRSILYTIHADLSPNGRDMDFTCCDWEAAIIARNIILITMVYDRVAPKDVWPIFYHLLLDDKSSKLLRAHCRMLIQASFDLTSWRQSKYGKFLKFCTANSLLDVRRIWEQCLAMEESNLSEANLLKKEVLAAMAKIEKDHGDTNMSIIRSAGPLVPRILQLASQSFNIFWTKGVSPVSTAGNLNRVNSTFIVSSQAGKTFNVHYGTDPLLAFPLAPALAAAKTDNINIKDLADHARLQFASWCASFKERLSSTALGQVVIRFYVGESLAFCRGLRDVQERKHTDTGVFANPWSALRISFNSDDYGLDAEKPAPLAFNIIETSNLADHTGLLNLLVHALPLLQRTPASIIHTNTLLRKVSADKATTGLDFAVCADIPTLSILLGIAPSSHTSHFTTHSNKHEAMTFAILGNSTGQLHEAISWRFNCDFIPNSIDNQDAASVESALVTCDSRKLADFFLSVYMGMFAEEDQIKNMQNISKSTITNMSIVHYTRASFAEFLALVRKNISSKVDWSGAMNNLIDLIAADRRFLMGSNNFQDLMCNMFLRNIIHLEVLTSAYVETVRTQHDRFHGWKSVPPIVCIVMQVPRGKLKILENMDADEIATPSLECQTSGSTFHNVHSSIQMCFGDARTSIMDGELNVEVVEDRSSWSGTSDLIVMFQIPAWILTISPKSTAIGLHIRSTPQSVMKLMSKIGFQLIIYGTTLADASHVHVVRNHPHIGHLPLREASQRISQSLSSERIVAVEFDSLGRKASNLTIRKEITEPGAAKVLQSGAKVVARALGNCSILATMDKHDYRFTFPYPISLSRFKTRIARTSSYVEIQALVRADFSDFSDLALFPYSIASDGKDINLLNMHYVNLDVLPSVPLPAPPSRLEWVNTHVGMTFSMAEKETLALEQKKRAPLSSLKESIAHMVIKYAGLQLRSPGEWRRVFGLTNPGDVGIHTLIFVNGMKFDLANHTLVLDACVVPLVESIMDKLAPGLRAITNEGVLQVVTLDDEVRQWKLVLPAFAERCRTWDHTDACEYLKKGIPVAVEGTILSPLCSCGKGKNLGDFGAVPAWKAFREEATRVAIGLLFAISFLEENVTTKLDSILKSSPPTPGKQCCAKCGGPGKPTLQRCTVCKSVQYCSRECQKADWKAHKMTCAAK